MIWLTALTFIVLSTVCLCEDLDAPIVHTKYGSLKGSVFKDSKGNDFYAFRSIPYAKPPVEDLRFKAPQKPEKWEGVRDATEEMPMCAQQPFIISEDIMGEEDCLYLNVYTPKIQNESQHSMPVMFFIHGGKFITGMAIMLASGPEYFMTKDVVIVTIHYRVGALGFLSLDHKSEDLSANNGLKDQTAALKWVNENIIQFGGDPNTITIFGESSGSSSVHYHLLSPLSKGLFTNAILESGTATTHGANGRNNSALHLAKQLNISTDNESEMIKALKYKVSANELIHAQMKVFFQSKNNEMQFGPPVIEGPGDDSFIVDHPRNIVDSGKFTKVGMMIGYNDMEGILNDQEYHSRNQTFKYDPREGVPYYFDQSKFEDIVEEEKEFYWNGGTPTDSRELIDVWTDLSFRYHAVENARKHGDAVPVYLYEFSMDSKLNLFKQMDPITATYPGASHVDELCYIYKWYNTPTIVPGSLEDISIERMITLWTNFARHGNPTPSIDKLLQDQIWLQINSKTLNYISLGNNLEAKTYDNANYKFWKSLYSKYDTFRK